MAVSKGIPACLGTALLQFRVNLFDSTSNSSRGQSVPASVCFLDPSLSLLIWAAGKVWRPDEKVIEQGKEGQAFFIIFSGEAQVAPGLLRVAETVSEPETPVSENPVNANNMEKLPLWDVFSML